MHEELIEKYPKRDEFADYIMLNCIETEWFSIKIWNSYDNDKETRKILK